MARAAAAGLIFALGGIGAVAVIGDAGADPPLGPPATVYVTQTVQARYQGWTTRKWAAHAVQNRRALNLAGKRLRANRTLILSMRVSMRRRWAPTVRYALELARVAYGFDQTERARCESNLNPFAAEGHGPLGLLQFKPSTWASTPFGGFNIYDPVAQALAGGWMVKHGRSSEWSCGL